MAPATKSQFPYPQDWIEEAEDFLSETEEIEGKFEKPKFPDTLMVCNLPRVSQEGEKGDEFAKLKKAINKKLGKTEEEPGFEVEMWINKETGTTDGVAFLKFPNKNELEKARKRIDGFKMGKKLAAIPMDDFDSLMELPGTFQQAQKKSAAAPKLAFLNDCNSWLLDDKGREQLCLRYQQDTEIYWLDPLETLAPYYTGQREKASGRVWCDWKVSWSPHGSFLVTMHKPGLALWGGDEMVQKRKLMHPGVQELMFSPSEQYLITWNGANPDEDKAAYRIWDVKTGAVLKEIGTPKFSPSGVHDAFPHLLFSPDSKLFARCTEREIHIHGLPSCAPWKRPGMNEHVPFRFENGISSFQWSPKDNVIAVFSPQVNDSPSCLTVVNAETGEILNNKSRLNFNATMHWQSEGDFLCVVLTKKGKVKDGKETAGGKAKNLDILRLREKNIPVETLDVEEGIKGFFWEPKSNRFAMLSEAGAGKTMLSFYSLANSKCEQVATFELTSQAYNKVYWCPEGQYFVVAAIGSGELMWGRLLPDKTENAMELLYKDEQVNLTHVEWDARGRYVLTSVAQPIDPAARDFSMSQDAGFSLWTFQGRPLHQESLEKLYSVHFRPTPPKLLEESEEAEVRRTLKQHSRRFEQLDDEARTRARREEREKKEKHISEFKTICNLLNTNYMKHATAIGWEAAQADYKERHRWRDVTELQEEIVSTKEEQIEFS
ncbi:unnamed protein product [Amoebophrya sp. A25]|nr:unnamed protein product [Amoebophrya sp. A25]|eukprot:GSA25T00010148001.1